MHDDTAQHGARVRIGWGAHGLDAIATHVDYVVIVDVLSFSTACAVAREAGAVVVPHDPDRPPPADVFVAGARSLERPSLSPSSLLQLDPGTRIVIPSPNGSRLLVRAREHGLSARTGCFRDVSEVARALAGHGTVGLIAAGERWPDGSIRFALEDWLGVGAIVARLDGPASVEARSARAAFEAAADDLVDTIAQCASGRELVRRGFESDVVLAATLDGASA